MILDLIHVLEKLWKAAYSFHAEGSLEADLWVIDRTLRILFGKIAEVVKGIRQSVTKRGLSGAKCKTLNAVANYLYRNRARMRTTNPRQRLAACQRPGRRRLQEPHQRSHGTIRHAVD